MSKPKDFILQAYNAFAVSEPTTIINYLRKCTTSVVPDDWINEQASSESFSGRYMEHTSAQSVRTDLSISVGIEGKYGVFSGSLQVNYKSTEFTSATSFNSDYQANIARGTLRFNKTSGEIKQLLDPRLMSELNSISNFKDAEKFTQTWGTHLVTGLNLGGNLFVAMQSTTNTFEQKTEMSTKVKAAYNSVFSISMVAEAASTVAKTSSSTSIRQDVKALGGDASIAARISPDDKQSFTKWSDTCTKETVSGIYESIEIFTLADTHAKEILKKYIDLTLLARSLNYPTIFSEQKRTEGFQQNVLSASTTKMDKAFKIIGGGASISKNASSFLVSSYPEIDSRGKIQAWSVASHDIDIEASPSDFLSAYAIAVYDPEDYLDIIVETANGTNKKIGEDEATVSLPAGYELTCGGCQSKADNSTNKYIHSSYPSSANSWKCMVRDYRHGATDSELTAYVIGVKSKLSELLIDSTFVEGPTSSGQHDNSIAVAKSCLCGGGIRMKVDNGLGNLAQMSYPLYPNQWEEYNKDHNGSATTASANAYAVFLDARVVK